MNQAHGNSMSSYDRYNTDPKLNKKAAPSCNEDSAAAFKNY